MPVSAAQKTALEEIINILLGIRTQRGKRELCGMFMNLVDRKEWPEYYEVIPEPRCINNIKASLEKGRYKEASDVYTDLSLVFWNALFYNEPKSQISLDADTLKKALETEWKKKTVLPQQMRTSPPPSSAQKVHGIVDQPEKESAKPAPPPPQQTRQTSSQPPTNTTSTTAAATSGSSKMTRSTPAPSTSATLAKPVPIRPKSVQRQASPEIEVDIVSADDAAGDEAAVAERDPESEEIVKQLEKGLPRWPGFGEHGWMEEASPDRLVELLQAIKNYKDVVGNKPSASLEAIPEESTTPHLSYTTPLSLKIIESRAKGKQYENAKEFDKEMARLFEKARRLYEPCSEAYGHVLLLQRLYQALTSANPPTPPYVSTQNFAALRAGPGTTKPVHGGDADGVAGVTTHRVLSKDRKFVDEVHHKGWTLKLADWVHLSNPDDPSRPIIAQVFRCWISEEAAKAGQPGITVSWYYRPEQTFHPAERKFWEGEVFKTSHFADHPVEDIIEKIACQFTARHIRGRPRPPYWYLGFPLYVCDSRYNDRDRVFVKIKNWNSCIPEEVRKSTEFMPIYPFERTVYPIRYPSPFLVKGSKVKAPGGIVASAQDDAMGVDGDKKKTNTRKVSGGDAGPSKGQYVGPSTTAQATASGSTAPTPQPQQPVQQQPAVIQPYRPPGPDRSVVTAAGGSSQGSNVQIEKLPPETTKHFDRDPYTNEMLWFSAPPLNAPRAPSAKHSLTYLHYLSMKRKQQREEQQSGAVNGVLNGDSDTDLISNKRQKVQQEVRPSVRETAQKLWMEMGMESQNIGV
ncbi:Chromatin structure-remodeling complex subunit rsc1 [Leucoagaricus sp. SymC.cos]|nr:Chromatin structure-remodeling complex subunit rsc1 [Leucoagaricus sp. SymC.cos]